MDGAHRRFFVITSLPEYSQLNELPTGCLATTDQPAACHPMGDVRFDEDRMQREFTLAIRWVQTRCH